MRKIVPIIILVVLGFFTFGRLSQIFFQQDEWSTLGRVLKYQNHGAVSYIKDILRDNNQTGFIRFVPMTWITAFIVFGQFGLHPEFHGIFSLIVTIINVILVYSAVRLLTKSRIKGVLCGLLWMLNPLSAQSITWAGTVIPSQFSFTFFILGLIFFIRFLDNDKNYVNLIVSCISMIISLLFKESGAFYPVVFTILLFFRSYERTNLHKVKIITIFIIPFFITLILPRLFSSRVIPPVQSGDGKGNTTNIIYNLFLVPARSLFHVYFPQTKIYELTYLANRIHYSTQTNGFVVESIVADTLSLLIAFYFLVIIFIVVLLADEEHRKIILLSLISLFSSTLPFIFFKNDTAILETRYYVFPALWGGLLLISTVSVLFSKFGKFRNALLLLMLTPMILYYISNIHRSLAYDISIGNYRRGILNTVSEVKPQLGHDNVFYFYTENNGFYEFQSGFGQTLSVFLYDSGKIPQEVLTDRDYWDPAFEGLKSFNQGKFGYFMTYSKLVEALKNNKDINLDSVYSFYWNPQKHTVKNVSDDIREKLKKDITNEEN